MGLLVDGEWRVRPGDKRDSLDVRSPFRDRITRDGGTDDPGRPGWPAEAGRYHLCVSHACPWSHRTIITRALKGLEALVPMSVVNWLMVDEAWTFHPGPGVVPHDVPGITRVHELYTMSIPRFSGRASVPVLWDTHRDTIVNNESADIARMFNSAFDDLGAEPGDYYPQQFRERIDEVNALVVQGLSLRVYRAGFARCQDDYDAEVRRVFRTLDLLEERLSHARYLVGPSITEADIGLFATLIRFDAVYHTHFKCNLRPIASYGNLSGYLRDLHQTKGFGETVHFDHIKGNYYESHRFLNPSGIVPIGPIMDLTTPSGRHELNGE